MDSSTLPKLQGSAAEDQAGLKLVETTCKYKSILEHCLLIFVIYNIFT